MQPEPILTITVKRAGGRLQGNVYVTKSERAQVYMEAVLAALMVLGEFSSELHDLIGRAAEEARRRG